MTKAIDSLIEGVYAHLLTATPLLSYIGSFTTDTTPVVAIAYNTVPVEYTLPNREKCFVVYSIDDANGIRSETRTHLTDITLKLYLSGDDALALADALTASLDGTVIATYYCTFKGITTLPSGDVTTRFQAI